MRRFASLIAALSATACISGCNVARHYGEQVLLSDGRVIYAELDAVIGPDEFLQPGNGPTKQLKVTFHLPEGPVVWPGTAPETGRKTGSLFPTSFDLLGNTPVVVIAVVAEMCPYYGNPSNGFVAYAYRNGTWQRIQPEAVPLTWRLNFMGSINNNGLRAGHTYSLDEIRDSAVTPVDSSDYSKTATWAQEVNDFRKRRLLCSQRRT